MSVFEKYGAFNDAYFFIFFSDFLYKSICC